LIFLRYPFLALILTRESRAIDKPLATFCYFSLSGQLSAGRRLSLSFFARHGKAEQNGPETLRAKDPVARIRMSFTANSRVVGKLFWRALREFQRRIEATAYEQA